MFSGIIGNGVLSAGEAFSPDDISGLLLWLDASDASTLTLSGSLVDEWRDKSGNNHHVSATGALRPTLTGTVHGNTAITFGGSQYLSRSDSLGLGNNPNLTFLAAHNNTSAGQTSPVWHLGTNTGVGGQDMRLTSEPALRFNNGFVTYTPTQTTGVDYVSTTRRTVGDTYPDILQRTNGSDLSVSGSSTGAFSLANLQTRIGGGRGTNFNQFFTGLVSRVLVYDSVLTGDDLTNAEAWMSS